MTDAKLAFLISGAGYGITILVLIIIAVIIRAITLVLQKSGSKKN